MMTVRELISQLEEYDPDMIVFMSSDPEGNSYNALAVVDWAYRDSDDHPLHREDWPEDTSDLSQGVFLWP